MIYKIMNNVSVIVVDFLSGLVDFEFSLFISATFEVDFNVSLVDSSVILAPFVVDFVSNMVDDDINFPDVVLSFCVDSKVQKIALWSTTDIM